MSSTAKCLLSAAAGAVVTFLALSPSSAPLILSKSAQAQEAKTTTGKASSGPLQPSANVKVDDENVVPQYANYARVTATPEEVILDFALNPQPFAAGEQLVKVSQRTVFNHYAAKRLMIALQRTIDKQESTFGPIELDVRKRAASKD